MRQLCSHRNNNNNNNNNKDEDEDEDEEEEAAIEYFVNLCSHDHNQKGQLLLTKITKIKQQDEGKMKQNVSQIKSTTAIVKDYVCLFERFSSSVSIEWVIVPYNSAFR